MFRNSDDFYRWVDGKTSKGVYYGRKHIVPKFPGYVVIHVHPAPNENADHEYYASVIIDPAFILKMLDK
jgi:hypothetical protein